MAQALLLSAAPADDPDRPHAHDELARMRRSAARDKFGVHALTDDPQTADVILFVENAGGTRHYPEVRRHPYVRKFREKCFLFTETDHALPVLPGIYASMEKRWYTPQRMRSGHYLRTFTVDFIEYEPEPVEREYLYSFLGAFNNHPIREAIADLDCDRQYLFDTAPYWPYGELSPAEQKRLQRRYVAVSRPSKFILCPRGRGASSYRLFESLRMGRPPVILSDQWVPPEGPDWPSFSVRVPERRTPDLPDILREREGEAVAMGERARRVWEDWFSEAATFHRAVEWCLAIRRSRALPESVLRSPALLHLLRPPHATLALTRPLFGMPAWR